MVEPAGPYTPQVRTGGFFYARLVFGHRDGRVLPAGAVRLGRSERIN
jgi:hypothetical protein